jgi:hypothetical protein
MINFGKKLSVSKSRREELKTINVHQWIRLVTMSEMLFMCHKNQIVEADMLGLWCNYIEWVPTRNLHRQSRRFVYGPPYCWSVGVTSGQVQKSQTQYMDMKNALFYQISYSNCFCRWSQMGARREAWRGVGRPSPRIRSAFKRCLFPSNHK